MKKQNNIILLIGIFTLLFCSVSSLAQRKVLGKPDNYRSPVDYFDDQGKYESFLSSTSPKSKDNAWLVFSDRDENPIFDKPDGSTISKIGFRDWFFVVEEKDDWIKIIEARVDELKIVKESKKEVGWVPKKNMLLWNSGLVGLQTGIHKKVLLLNRADQIERVIEKKDKELVQIYRGPNTEVREPDKRIFEYYFLLKKDRGMYLLSEEAVVNPFNPDKIIGWVRSSDCDTWDTRICLEPNYTEEAFNERMSNQDLKIRAYNSLEGAVAGTKGNINQEHVFWDYDPVVIDKLEMAVSNPRRFKGAVVRFPMVNKIQSNGIDVFRSGLVGSIKLKAKGGTIVRDIIENKFAQLKKQENELINKSKKVNFFFVIEGTDNVYAFQQQIIQAINNINSEVVRKIPEVNYGVLIYRDIPEENVTINGQLTNRMIEYVSLTPDIDKVTTFIQGVEFKNKVDKDDYTAMYYGLFQALQKGGFREDELNVIMMIGCYGDFRADNDRRKAAKGHPALFEPDDINNHIIANLDKLNAHLYSVQLTNDGYRPARGYSKACQYLMLENAKFAYIRRNEANQNPDNQKTIDQLKDYGYSDSEPTMELIEGQEESVLDGHIPGNLLKAQTGQYIPPDQLSMALKNNAENSVNFIQQLKSIISSIITEGNFGSIEAIEEKLGRDVGPLKKAVLEMIYKILEDNPKIALPDVLDEKYKLFTEVFIPYTNSTAQYPLVSYVLFMPELDLLDYRRTIDRLAGAQGSFGYDKKRELLFDVYKSLVGQFTGEGTRLNKRVEEVTRNELRQLMQGVYGMGLQLDDPLDHVLGDVKDEKKMSNEQIDELIQRFITVGDRFTAILREADTYDFCYQTDDYNRYYWITMEDAF